VIEEYVKNAVNAKTAWKELPRQLMAYGYEETDRLAAKNMRMTAILSFETAILGR